MKNKIAGSPEKTVGAGMTAIILPAWARILGEQNAGEVLFSRSARHQHHCVECNCLMICSYKYCGHPPMLCPECSLRSDCLRERASMGMFLFRITACFLALTFCVT